MRLDLSTKTLFAEFQEGVFARAALADEIREARTFVRKRVKGSVYWYRQRYEKGQYKQDYFGPSNEKNDAFVERHRKELRSKKQHLKQMVDREARLGAMLRRGGLPTLDKRVATVFTQLLCAGLVDAGGILVGTFAYMAYAGMMGVLFEKRTLKTNDIDIARDESVEVAIDPPIDLKHALSQSGMQFREVPAFDTKALPSSLVSAEGIRIDVLTPQRGRAKGVVPIRGIRDVGALEMPLLDFLIESPVRTVLLTPTGGIPLRVPDPARFVVHKLIVASRRPASESAKSAKDIEQAAQLIEVLSEERPAELKAAMRTAKRRGKKWSKYLETSLKRLSH
jgi:hypothetical protein